MEDGSQNTMKKKQRKCKGCKKPVNHAGITVRCFACMNIQKREMQDRSVKKQLKKQKTRSKRVLKKKEKKSKTLSWYKKKLDSVFSLFIRNKYANESGLVMCVSCRSWKLVKEMQNGHYVSRGHNSVRFSEKNCFPQCPSCNVFKNGNYPEYTKFLLDNFGQEYVDELVMEGRQAKSFSIPELKEMIDAYQDKLSTLLE